MSSRSDTCVPKKLNEEQRKRNVFKKACSKNSDPLRGNESKDV